MNLSLAPRQKTFEDLGTPLFEVPFCVLDLETTGGSPRDCSITEIGAVKYVGGESTGSFHSLVNPGTDIPPFITVLTGLTTAMVTAAPQIEGVLPAFLEFLGASIVVGHNVRFDLGFLNAAALRLSYGRLPNRSIDTAALARRLIRPDVHNLKLASLAYHFRSPVTPDHRALTDARATAHVFFALLEIAGTIGVTALDDLLELPTAQGSPFYSKIHLADELPRRPGVYMFLDQTGSVIYVGKATNLRNRVRSYFYGDERRSVGNMLRELVSITHVSCPTNLEAEITEIRMINLHQPRYNRRSRQPKASHWLKLTNERFPRLSMVRTCRSPGQYLGPFRSRQGAESVLAAVWDALPIRRCSGKAGGRTARCVPAQLGVALCPCDGTLSETDYEEVTIRLIEGLEVRPDLLLDPLEKKMQQLSSTQRYEEAAWARDRHRSLARALERRRAWQALNRAGLMELESGAGDHVLIDHGRLALTWREGTHPPLRPAPQRKGDGVPVPPSVEAAEEAHLIWQWIHAGAVRVIDVEGEFSLPAAPLPRLAKQAAP